jgi:hypothetical protein
MCAYQYHGIDVCGSSLVCCALASRTILCPKTALVQVTMRPQVNIVGDSESRIRSLEDQVRQLRKELATKEHEPSSPPADATPVTVIGSDAESAFEVESRLQLQLQQNQELLMEKEALARYGLGTWNWMCMTRVVVASTCCGDRTAPLKELTCSPSVCCETTTTAAA